MHIKSSTISHKIIVSSQLWEAAIRSGVMWWYIVRSHRADRCLRLHQAAVEDSTVRCCSRRVLFLLTSCRSGSPLKPGDGVRRRNAHTPPHCFTLRSTRVCVHVYLSVWVHVNALEENLHRRACFCSQAFSLLHWAFILKNTAKKSVSFSQQLLWVLSLKWSHISWERSNTWKTL